MHPPTAHYWDRQASIRDLLQNSTETWHQLKFTGFYHGMQEQGKHLAGTHRTFHEGPSPEHDLWFDLCLLAVFSIMANLMLAASFCMSHPHGTVSNRPPCPDQLTVDKKRIGRSPKVTPSGANGRLTSTGAGHLQHHTPCDSNRTAGSLGPEPVKGCSSAMRISSNKGQSQAIVIGSECVQKVKQSTMGISSNKGQSQAIVTGSECVQKVKTAGENPANSLWSMDVHNIPQKQPKWATLQTPKRLPVLSTVQHINRPGLMQNSAGSASTQREQESMLLSSATTDGFFVPSGGVKNNSNLGQYTASRAQQCADVQLWIA